MTGNIIVDFFLGLAIAGIGAGATYAAWRRLTDHPKRLDPRR
jgi:hypothetical protein